MFLIEKTKILCYNYSSSIDKIRTIEGDVGLALTNKFGVESQNSKDNFIKEKRTLWEKREKR